MYNTIYEGDESLLVGLSLDTVSSKTERIYDSLIEEEILQGTKTVQGIVTNIYQCIVKIRKNLTTGKTVVQVWSTETGKQFSPYGLKTPLD